MAAKVQIGGHLFIWDDRKEALNIERHGLDFVEAGAAFDDAWGMIFPDISHSDQEDRYIFLGSDARGRLLRVSFCYREGGDLIRLISARLAGSKECRMFFRGGR